MRASLRGCLDPRGVAPLVLAGLLLAGLVLAARGAYLVLVAPFALVAAAHLLLRRPDLAPPIFAFLLYTNASAVAVQFHGVPFVVAASLPLLLCLPIARDLFLRREAPVATPALPFILAFLAVQLFGALFALRPDESMHAFATSLLEGLLLYALVTNAIRTPEALRRVLWGLIAAGACMGALVGYQHLTGRYDDHFFGFAQVDVSGVGFVLDEGAKDLRQPRLGGPLGMPNRFSQIMAILVPIALFQIQASRSRAAKLAAGGGLALILVGFALGFSRGSAVGLAMTFLVMMAMGHVSVRHLAAIGVAIVGLLVLLPQYAVRMASLAKIVDLVTDAADPGLGEADSSTQGRITEMVAGVLIFADHPVIGVGPEMYRRHYPDYARIAGGRVRRNTREAHSLPIHVAAEHGLLGLAAFGAVIFVTLRDLLRARRQLAGTRPDLARLATGVFLAMVVFLTTSIFLHASYIRYMWFVFALAAVAARVLPAEEVTPARQLLRLLRVRVAGGRLGGRA
jgi:O-antigen ligase